MQGLSPDTCSYEASQGYYTTLHSFAAVLRIMIDEHEHEHDDEQADARVARVARRLGNAQLAKQDDKRHSACPMAWLGYYVTRPRADVDVSTSYLFERAGPGAVNVSWDDIVQRQQPANMEKDEEQKPVSAEKIRAWVKEFASKYELVRYDAGLGAAVVRHNGGGFGRQLCTVRCYPREMMIDLAKLDSPRMRLALDWARTSRLSVTKLALVRGVALQLDANHGWQKSLGQFAKDKYASLESFFGAQWEKSAVEALSLAKVDSELEPTVPLPADLPLVLPAASDPLGDFRAAAERFTDCFAATVSTAAVTTPLSAASPTSTSALDAHGSRHDVLCSTAVQLRAHVGHKRLPAACDTLALRRCVSRSHDVRTSASQEAELAVAALSELQECSRVDDLEDVLEGCLDQTSPHQLDALSTVDSAASVLFVPGAGADYGAADAATAASHELWEGNELWDTVMDDDALFRITNEVWGVTEQAGGGQAEPDALFASGYACSQAGAISAHLALDASTTAAAAGSEPVSQPPSWAAELLQSHDPAATSLALALASIWNHPHWKRPPPDLQTLLTNLATHFGVHRPQYQTITALHAVLARMLHPGLYPKHENAMENFNTGKTAYYDRLREVRHLLGWSADKARCG